MPSSSQRTSRRRAATATAAALCGALSLARPLLVAAAAGAPAAAPSSSLASPRADRAFPLPPFAATGPIGDAACDVEQLERANDSQLHVILAQLTTTAFFRSFAVDLDQRCPLAGWNTKKKRPSQEGGGGGGDAGYGAAAEGGVAQENATAALLSTAAALDSQGDEEEEGCAGGLDDLDEDAEPACSVDLGGSDGPPGFMGFSASAFTASALAPAEEFKASNKEGEEEEDEFECDGGGEELDEDAEPLCSLATDDAPPGHPFESTALHSISQQLADQARWASESQQHAFAWDRVSDPVVETPAEPCDDAADGALPDTFWLDMCSQIRAGDGLSLVNLQLNPERNTGYNGTHIWNAIYEENCLALDASPAMCYEERVLYRLLSGLHASTTTSIAKNYYPPSKRKGRARWEPNPQYFMDQFADRPERLRNLHFSYVVLLRALQKAAPFLYAYDIQTGDILDDEMATVLLRRLLDSTILGTCHDVFTAFDENLMFKERSTAISLRANFKGVFHNVSSILDCVQCQQCKLHGKMAMMGYGTALKILFSSEDVIATSLSKNEIVAFLNSIAKMSESVREVRELTQLYWSTHTRLEKSPKGDEGAGEVAPPAAPTAGLDGADVLDAAVGAVAALARQGSIDEATEARLVRQAFERRPELLVLSKHYGGDLRKFLSFLPSLDAQVVAADPGAGDPDAVVIGTGLAGLAAALHILDRGGRVTLVEKEHRLGGNSNKASSGMNACAADEPSCDLFAADTTRSAGAAARAPLIATLVDNSAAAVAWLRERVGVDLSVRARLGGHGHRRTHRPSSGMVGAEVIYAVQRAVRSYEAAGHVRILIDTRATRLVRDEGGAVVGVEVATTPPGGENATATLTAPNVVLATGGFASDRSPGSYLERYRPELMRMPATAGEFSTGDGVALGTAVGAGLVDMDKVQVHPTGWVDPTDPGSPGKVLAGELMRGVGGILLNRSGKRFCNELGTRAYVTDKMFSHDSYYERTKEWNITREIPTFSLVLSSEAADGAMKHVDHYMHKGLLTKFENASALAAWMELPVSEVVATLREYQRDAQEGTDAWGKTSFSGVPRDDLSGEVFYAGTVVPVLHYCMGGLTIDEEGSVLDEDGRVIPGLHAAGEVSGGVHGDNRLGGNSLLECTVFGTIVGTKLPIRPRGTVARAEQEGQEEEKVQLPTVTAEEIEQHNSEEDVWVAIHGKVYDLTEFAEEHPAGPESILELAGQDGTEAFEAVHSEGILEDFDPVGIFAS